MRITRHHAALAFSVTLLAACTPQGPAAPAPKSGEKVSSWMTDDAGSRQGKIIYMRNNTDAPIRITRLHIYECENVRNVCLPHDPGVTLAPGETRQVERVVPMRDDKGFSFRYRWGWEDAGR